MKRALVLALLAASACEDRPGLESGRTLPSSVLPRGFLLGTATSSHQIEGGNDNNWTEWEKTKYPDGRPHIRNNDQSGLADDSWNRFDEDLLLMKALGVNAYRFSLEWSRLEPRPGEWNEEAAARYLSWMKKLRANGIEPVVTLFHWTNPRWLPAEGFKDKAMIDPFVAYVRKAARAFGSEVDVWCVLNEPNVYALEGYIAGRFPPGDRSSGIGADVIINQMFAQARAGRALREEDTVDADGDGRATWIGFAHHVRVFQPASTALPDTTIAQLSDDYFNEAFTRALFTGRVKMYVPGERDIDEQHDELKGTLDWLGINYYTRDHIRADFSDVTLSKQFVPSGRPTNDEGWEVFPDGLYLMLKRFSAWGVPLYVTENGCIDTDGQQRPAYLRQHLDAVKLAVSEGADVRGYLHWSLLDNFEWALGFEPRFGLYQVDYANGRKRTPSPAVETFQEFAKSLGLKPR